MRIGVIIATSGRTQEVGHLLCRLAAQSMAPSRTVISAVRQSDVPANLEQHVEVMLGAAGLCAQRNRAMVPLLSDCDIIVFFDDDYFPEKAALFNIHKLFADDPGLVGATGHVLADGVVRGGVTYQDALAIIADYESKPAPALKKTSTRGLYGCNMAFRASAIGELGFDENLPLYGWQEDNDFSARMASRGHLVATNAFAGVHLGVRRGRTSGLRLGYSQIANPAYLARKGTMMLRYALWLMAKAVLANHGKILLAEPDIDRAGRARGNRKALGDLLLGRASPGRILMLDP